MHLYTIRLYGILLEINIRALNYKPHNRYGGRKYKALTKELTEEELIQQTYVQNRSIANTKRTFKRLLFANFSYGYTLLTLTFDPKQCVFDLTDSTICRQKFSNFWKRIKESLHDSNLNLHYLGVEEFHDNGCIHFHILCHIPREYESLLKKKWKHGHLDFRRSYGMNFEDVPKIANYLAKGIYDPRLNNQKQRYLASRGLNNRREFTTISDHIPKCVNENNSKLILEYESEYGFKHLEYLTSLTEDDFENYLENANDKELMYMKQQFELVQQMYSFIEDSHYQSFY